MGFVHWNATSGRVHVRPLFHSNGDPIYWVFRAVISRAVEVTGEAVAFAAALVEAWDLPNGGFKHAFLQWYGWRGNYRSFVTLWICNIHRQLPQAYCGNRPMIYLCTEGFGFLSVFIAVHVSKGGSISIQLPTLLPQHGFANLFANFHVFENGNQRNGN